MKYIAIVLMFFTVLIYGPISSQSASVSRIVGLASQCDTTAPGCASFPTQITTLCTINCPIRSSPSYSNPISRFWGSKGTGVGSCITSTDGGITWGDCTSQAFAAGTGVELYAEASDGSVIAVGTVAGTCTISRSTNNATSWSIVFTEAVVCSGGLEGQRLYCLSDGRCEVIVGASPTFKVYRSSDNGQSWTAESPNRTAPNCNINEVAWNGNIGIAGSENTGCGGGGVAKAASASSDAWSDSITWNGTQGDCWGATIYNGAGRISCNDGTTGFKLYTAAGGASVATLTLPGSSGVIDSGGVMFGYATNTLYIAALTSGAAIGLWVSRDNLVTFVQLGTFSGGGAGIRGGHMFLANSCIYVNYGLTAAFGKVC